MSIKNNFSKAVKDLLKKDNLVGDDLKNDGKDASELNRYLQNDERQSFTNTTNSPEPETVNEQDYNTMPSIETSNEGFDRSSDSYEVTVISRNTVIDGNISSFADMNLEGNVKGSINTTKNIDVSGKVVGDIVCNNASMKGSSMQGNVSSKGQILMDSDTILLGNINTQYADVNGKVKGNIEVGGKAELGSDAVIIGDINASTISVLDGAVIQGYINTSHLQEDSSKIFPDSIAVGD